MAKHPHRQLNAVKVRNETKPGRYADGNGLYLVVDPSGAKRWVLRTVVQGRRRDMGLGSAMLVSLADARDKAMQYRALARAGDDPFALRQQSSRGIPTFEAAARQVHADFQHSWKNKKHGDQWINTLGQYVFPVFGSVRVDQIQSSHVLQALSPIWLTKPETARRVKQRVGTVLDWAKAAGHRLGDNPVEGVTRGLPKQTADDMHHAALLYDELPAFVAGLRDVSTGAMIKLAFEFLILTAGRTSEVLLAEASEFDLEKKVWTVPKERMKAGKEHRVPLSPRCVEILKEVAAHGNGKYVFPSENRDKALSNMVFLMLLRRMGHKITAHGFRSTFRDWAAERTNFPREVVEAALAHAVENKVEAAYRRTDMFNKRRKLMLLWESYVCSTSAKVVKLHAA